MAISRIRGEQIRQGVLTNVHIGENAAIAEAKLAVNWASHYQKALETKKVVDFVQVNKKDVSGLSMFNLTLNGVLANTIARTTSNSSGEGVFIDAPLNKVVIRDGSTGNPVLDASGKEVFGRIVFVNDVPVSVVGEALGGAVDGINATFTFANKNIVAGSEKIYFGTALQSGNYTMDYKNGTVTFSTAPVSGTVIKADYQHDQDGAGEFELNFLTVDAAGLEVAFKMPASQIVDLQYAERFNLKSVTELFASNEKFVDGAADVSAHQNIHQLAADLYGAGYTLDRDGQGNLTVSIADQISNEIAARKAADDAMRADFASTAAGKGASLVGVEDLAAVFAATTVEGVLKELNDKIVSAQNGGSTTQDEVTAARASGLTGLTSASLDARLESDITELLKRIAAVQTAVDNEATRAKGEEARIEGKVDSAQAEINEAKSSTAKGTLAADGVTVNPKVFTSVDARVEELETDVKNNKTAGDQKDAEQDGRLNNLETEVKDARSSAAKATTVTNADGTTTTTNKSFANVDARLEEIEQDHKAEIKARQDADAALDTRADALEAEVLAARGTATSVDVRLDRALNENGTLKAGKQIHSHLRARFQAVGGEGSVLLSQFNKAGLPNFQVGDDSLEVFINGQLQELGLNYQEGSLGEKVVFDIGDGTVLAPNDIVTIKYFVNNAE